jgi:hypothetical protein
MGYQTITIDTVARGGHPSPKTYRLGVGSTRFESVATEADRARLEIEPPADALREWIGNGSYLDYVLSSASELLWVGERGRIESEDLQYRISRTDAGDISDSVPLVELLRPRTSGARGALGWHTELTSALADSLPSARFAPWRTAIFDGNIAVSRHLALSESGMNVCLIDANNRTKQAEAHALVSDRARWATHQDLKTLLPWSPPPGAQALLLSEDGS